MATHLDVTQWDAVDAMLAGLEHALPPALVALSAVERQRLVKMGESSEPFCRRALDVMRDSMALLPRSLDVDEMARDLASHDAVGTRRVRIARLMERMADTDIALGSDVMIAALDGYAALKRSGHGEGLHGVRRDLRRRFEGQGTQRREPAAAVQPASVPA